MKMKLLYSLVVCSLSLAVNDFSLVHAQKLEKLVIGYPAPVASLGLIDVTRKAGLFKKYGLDVDLVYIQGSPILTAAMMSGQVPLSFLGGAAIVASAVGGADTVYLGCAINTLYWRVFSSPEIKDVADLKGKRIGVTTIGSQDGSCRGLGAHPVGRVEQRLRTSLDFYPAARYRRRKARPQCFDRYEQIGLVQSRQLLCQYKDVRKKPSRHGNARHEGVRRRT
jgi:hypothetical protein